MLLAEFDLIFADVLAITLSVIGFLLSLQGLWLVSRALWPERVEAAARHGGRGGLRCFLLGLPVTFASVLVGLVVARLGTFGQLAGFSLLLAYVVYANVGAAGFVTHIGRRLASPADADRPWRATVRGGAALQLAWLVPVLGWFGLLPITLILGAGATTFALFSTGARAGRADAGAAPVPPRPARPQPSAAPERELEPAAPAGVE